MTLTFVEYGNEMISKARTAMASDGHPYAGREFALAITAVEDAQMRFNRGLSMIKHLHQPADVEKLPAAPSGLSPDLIQTVEEYAPADTVAEVGSQQNQEGGT